MATRSKGSDSYSNIITTTLAESAGGTLTFEEINVGLNLFDKVGLIISRIEYEPSSATLQNLAAADDKIIGAIVTSNQLSTLGMDQPAVIDTLKVEIGDVGTAATALKYEVPIVKDFSTLPGGGLLVAPKPLFFAVQSANLGAAGTMSFRFYFTIIQLKDTDYLELLESRRFFS